MNRLQHETSPYLLQHADNPVDWYPWGEEALAKAKAEDKPILLSVGYSSCHWCHVMAHESFEDNATAKLMNEWFINIKVDREERPDVDDIYMQATLMFTRGHGGWPMTVFMLPDGRPFHAGTYFPREPRYIHGQLAIPSFMQVIRGVLEQYHSHREDTEQLADKVADLIQKGGILNGEEKAIPLEVQILKRAADNMLQQADTTYGGLHRGQPKFPSPMNYSFLLRYHSSTGDEKALQVATLTLKKMAQGGMYDQLGGGFHRYSVDNRWLVPHFEKMLYDNAQLARLYLHAYQLTNDSFFADVCRDILTYVQREMLDECGGFYSAQDADSEGEEGKFFVWSLEEVQAVLSKAGISEDEIGVYADLYDINQGGNFEGHNIPNRLKNTEHIADDHDMSVDELEALAQRIRPILFEHREQRIKPGLDDKMLAAWNGMMLTAFAEAARIFDDATYRAIAIKNAEFLLNDLSMEDGRLYRTHKRQNGAGESKILGYLEDYANVIDGLLELYQTSFDARWYHEAKRLNDYVLEHFWHNDKFYDTSDEHEQLVARPRNVQDNATPSGNNLMAHNLLRLGALSGEQRYSEFADKILTALSAGMQEYPKAFGVALNALHLQLYRPLEVAIVGDVAQGEGLTLLNTVQKAYRPRVVVAVATEDQSEAAEIPLLAHRKQIDGQPTVYVCEDFICQRPVTTPESVQDLLK